MNSYYKDFKLVRYIIRVGGNAINTSKVIEADDCTHIGLTQDKTFVVIESEDKETKQTFIPIRQVLYLEK